MVGQATFFWYVRQVFARLHDPSYLIGHPLAALLVNARIVAAPEGLREAVLATLDSLQPPPSTPPGSSTERRWRSLSLRHVDGLSFKQIAQQLQVSERQALRDHKEGVEAAAAVLWARYRQRGAVDQPADPGIGTSERNPSSSPPASAEDLESGLARVAALSTEEGTADLAETLRQALAVTGNLSTDRGAEIRLSLADGPMPVAIEPSVLRQILICLLSAALQSVVAPRVEVAATVAADAVSLEVVLQGRRPRGHEDAADELMALVESARRLAELRNGAVQVGDTVAGVRRIVLRLRAVRPATVLLVDDNPDLADLFRWYLAGTDYRVVQARAPSTALELARELRPDVIILDVMLPSQDGWQLLHQLRGAPATDTIPVIICSILPERSLALSLGVADFLAKPVTQESLRAALARCRRVHRPATHPDRSEDTASARPR